MAGVFTKRTIYWTRKKGSYNGVSREFVVFYPFVRVNHSYLGAMWEPRQDPLAQPGQDETLKPESDLLHATDLTFVADFDLLGRDKDNFKIHGGQAMPQNLFPNAA